MPTVDWKEIKLPPMDSPLVDQMEFRLNGTEAELAQARGDTYPAPCVAEAPQPVRCCWNGGVAISAAAFYAGLRFRRGASAMEGREEIECDFSECSVLCRDLRMLGFDRIEADPTVQARHWPCHCLCLLSFLCTRLFIALLALIAVRTRV